MARGRDYIDEVGPESRLGLDVSFPQNKEAVKDDVDIQGGRG